MKKNKSQTHIQTNIFLKELRNAANKKYSVLSE